MDGLRQIVQLLRRSAAAADRRAGLSGAQLFVLGQLADGRPASVNDLAGRTRTHQSSASVIVRRLADRGLVRHGRSATDRRRVEVTLTAAGRRTLARAPSAAQDRLIAALLAMPPRDRKSLADGLGRLAELAGAADPRPGLFFEEGAAATR